MGQVHPKVVAEHAEVFGIIGDEAAADIRRAVFLHATEKFEDLRGLEMLEQVTAVNAVASAGDFAEVVAPQKLKDVDLEILDAEFFAGGNRFSAHCAHSGRDRRAGTPRRTSFP